MVAGTMAQNQSANGDTREQNRAPEQAVGLVPFVRASDEHIQPGNVDTSQQMDSSQHDKGVFDIPAYGHIAWLYIKVTGTGGAGGSAALAEDGPFNVLQNIALTEPNGAYIVQYNNGYDMYLANKWGGYLPAISADPKSSPFYSDGGANGNFAFILRVPVQLSGRDAVGALPNQDSAGQFKLRFAIAPDSTVFDTNPVTTLPSVRVQAWLAAWDQPEPQTAGMSNQVSPPASGTTSFWSSQSGISIANGENNVELKRRGNYLRVVIFVLRTSGSRSTGDGNWPSETRFLRDAFPARYYDDDIWEQIMYERTGFTGTKDDAGALDNGVRVHDYAHEFDGELGRENRDLWQPTRGSTRLELAGSFGAASTLDIITNDVAIADNVFLG